MEERSQFITRVDVIPVLCNFLRVFLPSIITSQRPWVSRRMTSIFIAWKIIIWLESLKYSKRHEIGVLATSTISENFSKKVKVTVDFKGQISSKIIFFTPNSRLLLYINIPKKLFQKLMKSQLKCVKSGVNNNNFCGNLTATRISFLLCIPCVLPRSSLLLR